MSPTTRYKWVDSRADFLGVLGDKLGPEWQLTPFDGDYSHVDGLIVGVPPLEDSGFESGLETLTKLVLNPAALPVIAMLRVQERQVVLRCLSVGAYDYFVETAPLEELRIVLQRAARYAEMHREIVQRRKSVDRSSGFDNMIGLHQSMIDVFKLASRVADTEATVLISGESGTGKELLALSIHESSGRRRSPFVPVSCTAFPETLIEAELFGHEKGAFTGAASLRKGRFEAAENGTIFLDEIGELPPPIQTKLLRVLQERSFERLGSNLARPMNARVICATNRDLKECIKQGTFRLDLYYRLNTVEIELPALRDRWDDIEVLASTFLNRYAQRYNRPAARVSPAVRSALRQHKWPGNVRELEHVIERAVVISDGPEIKLEHLPTEIAGRVAELAEFSFDEEVRNFKRRLIQRALVEFGYNKLQAARSLKMPRTSLHRLIDDLDIADADRVRGTVEGTSADDRLPN